MLAIAAIASVGATSSAWAQSVPRADAETHHLWFVELSGAPVADGARLATVQSEKAAFRTAARAAGVHFTERRSFDTLFNGFSVEITAAERKKLARVTGVRALYPVMTIPSPRPTPQPSSAPDMAFALGLSNARAAQNSLGLSGAGVKVAVIDSGIDIDHPAFGGSGVRGTMSFPNARVYAGHDFVGDNFTGSNAPVPDDDPRDCPATGDDASGGHGTHVAGIIGANGGGILGVAPQAKLAAYRVFGCNGNTTSDILLAAMEQALLDGAQVINQSIGARAQWPQYPTGQASARLAKKGVVMVASIGNNGPDGSSPDALFAAGAPGVGDGVIGVASYDNAQLAFTVGGTPYGFNQATGSPAAPTSGSMPLARTGTTATPDDGCDDLPPGSLSGMAVLIRRGTCSFNQKAANAQDAGAAAVVLYNNASGALNPTVAGPPNIGIPVIAITNTQGAALDAQIAAGPTTLVWTSDSTVWPNGTGGLISGFSSFGLAADLSVKPDLGAPGGGIVSAYPLELGGSATLSGTSMSSPHVAGAAALILQAVPTAALGKTSALVGRNAPPAINMATRLMNTSQPKAWSGNPGLGLLEQTYRQGAGMIDVVAAVQSRQFVVPAKFSTGESQGGPTTQRLTIRNDASASVTYSLSHVGSLANGPNATGGTTWAISATYNAPATVSFNASTVTVPANGVATVDVTVTANASLPDLSLYGGYIKLTPQGQGAPLQVIYGGLKGDYQATQVLRPTANGFPWLAYIDGEYITRCGNACTYTMADEDNIPYLVLHLDHLSRHLKYELFDAATSTSRGVVAEEDYVTRNTTPSGYFLDYWDGTTSLGTAPNGRYFIRISVLKALGDPANPADYETWDSPEFTVARP